MPKIDKQTVVWKAISVGVGALAGLATDQALARVWKRRTGNAPAKNPADRSESLVRVLMWGVATGVGAGVTRVLLERTASVAWEAALHDTPPGVPSR